MVMLYISCGLSGANRLTDWLKAAAPAMAGAAVSGGEAQAQTKARITHSPQMPIISRHNPTSATIAQPHPLA